MSDVATSPWRSSRSNGHALRGETGRAISVERRDSFDAPGLAAAWDALCEVDPRAHLFSTYAWCRSWAETVGRESAPLILQVRGETGETIGLAPLCLSSHRRGTWLEFLGRRRVSGDHLDVVAAPGREPHVLAAVADWLDEHDSLGDGIELGELHEDGLTHAHVKEWARRRGYSWIEQERRRVPYVDLPASFEEYLASRSSNMRYHVRRRRRGFERLADASIERVDGKRGLADALEDFFRLHHARWRRDGLSGNFQAAGMRDFLHRFCAEAAGRGWLRIYLLRFAGTAVASLVAFHWKNVAYYYQMGWAPDCPLPSPGVILLAESIEQAVAEGCTRYDLLQGDESYKSRWTDRAETQITLVVGRSRAARAQLRAERLKNRVKSVVRHCIGPGCWEAVKRTLGRTRMPGGHVSPKSKADPSFEEVAP